MNLSAGGVGGMAEQLAIAFGTTVLANLFDIAMVFVVALLIALVSRLPQQRNPSELSAFGQIPIEGESLKRYQIGKSQIGGQGKQLGMAYQLESGEVIYVPQE